MLTVRYRPRFVCCLLLVVIPMGILDICCMMIAFGRSVNHKVFRKCDGDVSDLPDSLSALTHDDDDDDDDDESVLMMCLDNSVL